MEFTVSKAPDIQGERFDSVEAALANGPKFFQALMAAIGTNDPRAVIPELEQLRKMERLGRGTDGEFLLKA
jgi:hypothetical protein